MRRRRDSGNQITVSPRPMTNDEGEIYSQYLAAVSWHSYAQPVSRAPCDLRHRYIFQRVFRETTTTTATATVVVAKPFVQRP